MSSDLHELMSSLADGAPELHNRIALADAAYADGRRRRTVRILEKSAAATVVVVCLLMAALFVGSSPIAARYGASSTTSVSGYPRHIGEQFPILDLPAKPGPIAGLLAYQDGWWAVSPTGHRWKVPQSQSSYLPAVSADGRMIGYLKGNEGPYVVRDLVSGTTVTVPSVGSPIEKPGSHFHIQPPTVGYFSADDRYLALTGADNKGQATVAIDTRTGTVTTSIHANDLIAGWAGDDVVSVSLSSDHVATAHSLDGGRATRTSMKPTTTLPEAGPFAAVVSSDGTTGLCRRQHHGAVRHLDHADHL